MLRHRNWILALGTVAGFVAGCRTDFSGDCPVGSEECPCTENGACDEGLVCLSNTCVQDEGETGDDTNATRGSEDGSSSSSSGDGDSTTDTSDSGDGDGAMVDPPEIPELRTPIHGDYIGSAHASQSLRPRFSWTAVDLPTGASSLDYEIEVSTDANFGTSTGGTISGTAWQPADGLPVAITQPVGDRYHWRVRACADGDVCSGWSEPRWVMLGRPLKDVNGDGYPDVLASEPNGNFGGSFGVVRIHRGGQGAGFDTTADWTLTGDIEGYKYGRDVVAADVNGDGYADTIVGSYGLNDRGRVQVHLGSSSGPTFGGFIEFNDRVAFSDGHYGWHLGAVGDVNGDGYADFAAGEPGSISIDGNFPGYVHVYLGAPAFTNAVTRIELQGISDSDRFGSAVTGCDVNGDGYSDVIVGAPERAGGGAAYIYAGSSGGISNTPWATLTASGSTEFGRDLACAGDVNGDGYRDVIVGDVGGLSAHLFYGAADPISGVPDHTVSGPANSLFGRAVGTGGDMDRDGFSEFIVTAPGYTVYQSGALLIWRGNATNLQSQADGQMNFYNMNQGEAGAVLGLARDTNGDGFIDVPAAKGYSYSGVFVFMGDGDLTYPDTPAELTGSNDYGMGVY